tara:strand:+ start:178 stop:1290 length:1113 start_codon:yes stop_codon:yes gene_type:complete
MKNELYSTRLYIHCENLAHNINKLYTKNSNQRIIAMIKANAYGHGDIIMAKKMEEYGIQYFGVADFEEGIRLRQNDIESPIMVMNPASNNLSKILDYDLEPVIYNQTLLNELVRIISLKSNKKFISNPCQIHIKFNTGMNRWGFNFSEINSIVDVLSKYNNICVKSIYSHLASASNKNDDVFTHKQLNLFNAIRLSFCKFFDYKINTHIYNSAGFLRFKNPDAFNYCRIGLALYGSMMDRDLKPISELKCPVSQIRIIQKNEAVGYNLKYMSIKKMKIGVIPFGYADGLQRQWGDGVLNFFYKGKLIPTIGNISMDSCAVDLSNINDISEGNDLLYFGIERPIWELAKELNTIPYEITATLSKRIKRIYC